MKKILLALTIGLMIAPVADAVPDIQLFIDGATYDWNTQTWVATATSVDLYVINANDVKDDIIVSMALAGYGEFDTPDVTVDFDGTVYNTWEWGFAPIDNALLPWQGSDDVPRHGIFPTWFAEAHTGFYGTTDFVGDVQPDENNDYWDPSDGVPGSQPGEFKVFSVDVSGSFAAVHFDAYTVDGDGNLVKFAPFSHDASIVPEPGTILLMGSGLLGLGLSAIRRRKR
jgi:hypothetical protein